MSGSNGGRSTERTAPIHTQFAHAVLNLRLNDGCARDPGSCSCMRSRLQFGHSSCALYAGAISHFHGLRKDRRARHVMDHCGMADRRPTAQSRRLSLTPCFNAMGWTPLLITASSGHWPSVGRVGARVRAVSEGREHCIARTARKILCFRSASWRSVRPTRQHQRQDCPFRDGRGDHDSVSGYGGRDTHSVRIDMSQMRA